MTLPLLAELLPDPNSPQAVGWVLIVIFAILAGALIVKQLLQRTPSLDEQFVTRREFNRHVEDVAAKLTSIEEKGEARVVRIYDKIDDSADKTVARIVEIINARK